MTEKLRKLTTSLVLQVFWDDIASVVKNIVFPGGSSLSAQTYNSLADIQKYITPKPLTVSGHASNHWKDEKIFYNYCIGLMVRFSSEQFQIRCFLATSHSEVRIDVNNRNFCFGGC
jgi:hypothetical protein